MNKIFKNVLSVVLMAACGFFLFRNFQSDFYSIPWVNFKDQWVLLLFGFFFAYLNAIVCFGSWVTFKEGRFGLSELKKNYFLFSISNLSKYFPFGKGVQALVLIQGEKKSASPFQGFYALLQSVCLGMIGGFFVATPGLFFLPIAHKTIVIAGLILLFLLCWVLVWHPNTLVRCAARLRISIPAVRVTIGVPLRCWLIATNILGWFLLGASQYIFLSLLNNSLEPLLFWKVLTSYYIASWAGYFAFFVPMGLGVTEVVLVFFSVSALTPAFATLNAILLRLACCLSDILFSVPGLFFEPKGKDSL